MYVCMYVCMYNAWAKESATCLHNIAGGVADSFAHALYVQYMHLWMLLLKVSGCKKTGLAQALQDFLCRKSP